MRRENMLPPEGRVPTSDDKVTVSRRRLLKALAVAGGGVAATLLLPAKWLKPIVEVGVLPVHAQVSRPTSTPTSTPTPTPTSTPTPTPTPQPAAIIGCVTENASGAGGIIGPTDTIRTYAIIAPVFSGRLLRRTITLDEPGHPRNGVVDMTTGYTNAAGIFEPANFDLNTLAPPTISPGAGRLTILWGFVNPAEGTNTCTNDVDIV
jgi:hypothetical protein